jgi:hypothetical protein
LSIIRRRHFRDHVALDRVSGNTQSLCYLAQRFCVLGFTGSYDRVAAFPTMEAGTAGAGEDGGRGIFIPLRFAPGEAFQFDWRGEDWAVIDGERTKLQVAQLKLSHSRAFFLRAYVWARGGT